MLIFSLLLVTQFYLENICFLNFCSGIDVHALAEPTKLEAMKKEFEQQKSSAKDEHKSKLLEKYGGEVSVVIYLLCIFVNVREDSILSRLFRTFAFAC